MQQSLSHSPPNAPMLTVGYPYCPSQGPVQHHLYECRSWSPRAHTTNVFPMHTQTPVTVRTFTQRFSSTPKGARLARLLTLQQLSDWGIPYATETSDNAALIVAELATNAITHGRVPGRDFELRLTLDPAANPPSLLIQLSDARSDRLPVIAATLTPNSPRGYGLTLITTLATDYGAAPRRGVGKTVWAVLRIPPIADPRRPHRA